MTAVITHCDNQSTTTRAQNTMYNGKSRHIHHRHNNIRHLISNRVIATNFTKLKDNLADPLMKGISRDRLCKLVRGMRLKIHNYKKIHSGNPTLYIFFSFCSYLSDTPHQTGQRLHLLT